MAEVTQQIVFNEEELAKVQVFKDKYPDNQSAIMPVLWLAQSKWGWLSREVMEYVGDILELPYSHIYGVATFYTMYFKKPMGKNHVQICTNVSCMLRGGHEIYAAIKKDLGIGHNETMPDGNISLEEVECLGACGGAPMIAINETYHENIDLTQVRELISKL